MAGIIARYVGHRLATDGRQPHRVAGSRKLMLDMTGMEAVDLHPAEMSSHDVAEIVSRFQADWFPENPDHPYPYWPRFRVFSELAEFFEWCLESGASPNIREGVEHLQRAAQDEVNIWVRDHCSPRQSFGSCDWDSVPDQAGIYLIYDDDELVYVGMAGRDGAGSLRRRLRGHSSGQVVNMFAQYLFLDRVQFAASERIRHPRQANQACHDYIAQRCSFVCATTKSPSEARALEDSLKACLQPTLNS